MAEMPFADYSCFIACILERLRQQPLVGRKAISVALRNYRRLETVAHRVSPRHYRGARRRAHWLCVKLLELCAFPGKVVEIRFDIGAVEADVFPSEIISYDVKNVGRPVRG